MPLLSPSPPIPTTASRYQTDVRFYVGGPLGYVRDASLVAGVPAEWTAETTVAAPWDPLTQDDLVLDDASDFTDSGAVRLTAFNEDSWYTFESRSGNTLKSLRPVFDKKSPYTRAQGVGQFDIGTVASQWYDISTLVDDWTLEQHEGDAEAFWTLHIRGTHWSSLRIDQDAAILAVADHIDSILGQHDPHILFSGFLGEPSVTGDPSKNVWEASAEGLRKYLLLQRNTPRQVGGQLVKGTWTASEALGDVGAEPMEGINPSDFAIANVDDDDIATPYVSKDVPSVTELVDGPTGTVQVQNIAKPYNMLPYTGQGLRIHMLYLNPVPSGVHSAQDQKFIVLYNNTQIEPPDQGEADTVSVLEWGKIDITQYSLWTQNADQDRPLGLYLGSKNGGPAPSVVLMPHQAAVLCYDEQVLRSQWSLPPGWIAYEIKQCAGELFGTDPNVSSRGMGLAWDPNPNGCWIALRRGGRAGNYTDSMYSGQVVSEDTVAGTITLHETGWTNAEMTARMATFPPTGYVRGESSDIWKCYTGVDSANRKLTGVSLVKAGQSGQTAYGIEVIGGDNPSPGERINVSEFSGYWQDFVAVGENIISKIPRQFPVRRAVEGGNYTPRDGNGVQTGPEQNVGDGAMVDQNDSGRPGEWAWGLWDNGGALTVYYDDGAANITDFFKPNSAGWNAAPTSWKVAPACPRLQAIRRTIMGGGALWEKASAPSWKQHDSNSFADWQIQTGPRLGNLDELDSYVWLEFQPEELDRAIVVVDNSDVNDDDGTLTVEDYQAREYPGASPRDGIAWYLRALIPGGGNVDFRYDGREDSRFTGIKKGPGFEGVEIPAGSELVTMVNSRASWNKTGARAYVQRNMPRAIGLSLAHWRADPPETIVTEVTDTTVTVLPGAAAAYPTSGEIRFTLPPSDGGIIVTAADFQGSPGTNANGYTSYSGRTDDTFTGITWATGRPQPGWILSGGDGLGASFPDDMDILLTREANPASPVTFLDRNESWDKVYTLGNHSAETARPNAAMVEKYFPFSGQDNPFFWRLFVKVHRMSNLGRVAASRLRVHKMPYRVTSPGGTSVDWHEWTMSYLTSTLAHDILVEAGVDPAKLTFRGGSDLFSQDLADGSPWGEARGLARMSGCILLETADGRFQFHEHPQAPGAHYGMGPKLTLDGDALWGPVRATERPRHAVGQVIGEYRNGTTDMQWTIEEPNDALVLGEIRRLPAQIVQTEEAGHAIARLALRYANGGWEIDCPMGPPAVILEYGDVVRVQNVSDEAGRFFNSEFMVSGIRHSGGRSRMRSTIRLKEWQVV